MAEHIQIGDIAPRIQYRGDGTQTVFTFPFPIFDDADIEIYEDTTLQTITTHYTVAGAGDSAGGTVTFVTAPANGVVVTLRRNVAIERTSDFQESGEFRAKVINDELDKLTATQQQIETDQDRSLRLGPTDSATSTIIPDKATRSSKVLGFDANGDPAASSMNLADMESGATNATANASAAAASAASADADATTATTKAAEAATSASSAATSASAAATSASNASTSESNADADATATAADRVQTGLHAAATAADVVSTNADAVATAADKTATNAAAAATAADAVSTAADAVSTDADKTAAAASAAAAAASAAGGLYSAVQEKSANYTFVVADQGDLLKVDATSGPVTITLDALATLGVDSKCAIQKVDSSANAVTVQRSSSDTINGATSFTIANQWDLYELIGDTSTGKWIAVNLTASGLSGGNGISYSGGVISIDLATVSGLEFNGGKLQTTDAVRSMDMPFNAGFGPDYTGEDLAVQTYGELVVSRAGSFTGEVGYIDTVTTGSTVIVDVQKNGMSIYTTKPQFAASANSLSAGTLKTDGTEDFVSGDRITFKVTQKGSTVAGRKLRFTAIAQVTS